MWQLLQRSASRDLLWDRAKLLEEKNQSITELEKELSHYKQEAAVSKTMVDHPQMALEETKAILEASEAKYADYRAEKEPMISKLQQDLTEA